MMVSRWILGSAGAGKPFLLELWAALPQIANLLRSSSYCSADLSNSNLQRQGPSIALPAIQRRTRSSSAHDAAAHSRCSSAAGHSLHVSAACFGRSLSPVWLQLPQGCVCHKRTSSRRMRVHWPEASRRAIIVWGCSWHRVLHGAVLCHNTDQLCRQEQSCNSSPCQCRSSSTTGTKSSKAQCAVHSFWATHLLRCLVAGLQTVTVASSR
jgi:hypothetical protein